MSSTQTETEQTTQPSAEMEESYENKQATKDASEGQMKETASSLVFNDVCVDVKTPTGQHKRLIYGASGSATHGELVALMGPSGSGKTTLLMTLAGRFHGTVHGEITTDNKKPSKATRRKTALVTQQDVMWETLTVWDTLMYCAMFRMAQSKPREEKRQRVNNIIDELNLRKSVNTIVGGYTKPGISGGEKKRVSVGLELIAGPTLLILDEPTSGLDATVALKLVNLLLSLSQESRKVSVVMSIHQPASRIFQSLTKLIILSEGECLYQGTPAQLPPYFKSYGHEVPNDTNPADWILDVASGDFYHSGMSNEEAQAERKRLCNVYRTEIEGKKEINENNHGDPTPWTKDERVYEADWIWPTGWLHQVRHLTERNLKARREAVLDWWRIGQNIFIAVLAGLLWFNAGGEVTNVTVKDITGLVFFTITHNAVLPLILAIFTFPPERTIVAKEKGAGWYRLSSYYFSRMITDLPLDLFNPFIFVCIFYFMADLRKDAGAFFAHMGTVFFGTLVASSWGLFICAAVMDLHKSQIIAGCFLLATLLSAGFFVSSLPYWMEWIQWLSFIRYALSAGLRIQFPPDQTFVTENGNEVTVRSTLPETTTSRNYAGDYGALLIFLIIARVGVYFALMFRLSGG